MSEYHSPIPSPGEEPVRPVATIIAPGGQTLANALPLLESRLARSPNDATLLLRAAEACQQVGRWDEALGYARRADALAPAPKAADLIIDCLFRIGDDEALNRVAPEVLEGGSLYSRGMISLHLIKNRQFVQGFEVRHALRHTQKSAGHAVGQDTSIPWWDGQRFEGRLLVIAEQALGEELLSSSGVARLAEMGQDAVVESDPRLIPLFKRSFPALEFVPRFTPALASAALPGCRKTSASEFGYLLFRDDAFRNPTGWLTADPVRVAQLRADYQGRRLGKHLVGISWRSFRPHWGAVHKTMQLTDLASVLSHPDIAPVNLQYGDVREDLAAVSAAGLPGPFSDDRIDAVNDIDGFAAQVAAMDIVVTTSNTTAHMAGALGKPTILMLQTTRGIFPYWCYEGETTPWYPTIHIVRGDAATPIPEFVARVCAVLDSVLTGVLRGS